MFFTTILTPFFLLLYSTVPSYTTVYNALSSAGIVSPRARIPVREKKKHLPRDERPNEGDLVQVDGSRHDWFLNGHRLTLHGAIDDATHEIVGLYFCENECLLGYNEIMKQIAARKGGFPRAIYYDRSSIFFTSNRRVQCPLFHSGPIRCITLESSAAEPRFSVFD